ncbi:outer membrane protein assembly factor BamB family protein [Prosthecomicrobium sp. N25]|uniref:outer membrane protein assembly factor BamB family protein n=1 Tax=Prosthecomicrobium sp. N25 TaxID=3129254 RepID=UPI0030774529
MRKSLRLVVLSGLAAALLSGCTSSDDISDAMMAINPFSEKEKILPGTRIPVLPDQQPSQLVTRKPVSVPGPRATGNWGQAGGPPGNNPGHAALEGSGGTRVWAASAADVAAGGLTRETIRVFARPVAADGRIFVYDPNGNVSAHSASGGGRLWRVSVQREGVSDDPTTGGGVASDGPRVYAATGYGTVVALDASSGGKVWEKRIGEPARSAPTVADGKIFVVSQGNVVYALNASDGSEAWSFRGVPESGGLLASANPAVSGGKVVVPFTSGELVAIDIKTGQAAWSDALARASRNYAVSGLSDIAASPVVDDGVVYATGVGSRTVAIQLKDGNRIWEKAIGSAHTPAVAGNAVFVVDLDDNLIAIERKTGDVLWTNRLPVTREKKKRTNWAGPVLAGGSLWLVSNEGGLIALNPTNGQVVNTLSTGEPAMIAPVVAGGKLIVLTGSGTLAAYN